MKGKAWAALAAAALLIPCAAWAEETFDGTVQAGTTLSITAPFGGTVKELSLREGELLEAGDIVATLSTTRVLATQDGTIRGIFASEGDSAEGTVLYLSPVNRYTLSCTLTKANEEVDTLYVRLGEKVYIQCVKDGSHRAEGVVTAVNGSGYTVLTTAGEMYLQESAYIYRSSDYDSDSRIGTGLVQRTAEEAVSGTGSILKIYVQDGDEVERGQLLFETVEGTLDGLVSGESGEIAAETSGVVTEVKVSAGQKVQKGEALAVIAPRDSYEVAFSVPEDLLSEISVGQQVKIYFNWNDDKSQPTLGTITAVSYLSEEEESGGGSGEGFSSTNSSETMYTAYASFTPEDSVRLGMTVTVVPVDDTP